MGDIIRTWCCWMWSVRISKLLKTVPLILGSDLPCFSWRGPLQRYNISICRKYVLYPHKICLYWILQHGWLQDTLPCFKDTDSFFAAGECDDELDERVRFKNRSIKRNDRFIIQLSRHLWSNKNYQARGRQWCDITWYPCFWHSGTNLVIQVPILSFRH